ncbi:hypothetical protein JCGZ_05084 [Jatropha curcas]|uniref:Uncharacterized protein n=1 Tax=Jatropha curcas TaxID=180498 RepID=A0A067KXV4_JATCU|nr:hypothetical protein JCGZ_05084 [Jatropha curcas]
MPLRYKCSRPTSSVADRQRSTTQSSTVSPPSPSSDAPPFEIGDSYRLMVAQADNSDDAANEDAGATNIEEDNPPPFPAFGFSSGAGTSRAGPSFQGTSNMSNDEVLARMMSRMDMFDTRLHGMESMIADPFQSIKIMHGSLNSRMDTM